MKLHQSEIGGEGNGGVILKESHLGRDSLVASALVLNYLAKSNLPLNKIMKHIPSLVMIKDKVTLQNDINFNDIKQNTNAEFTNREIKVMYSESF